MTILAWLLTAGLMASAPQSQESPAPEAARPAAVSRPTAEHDRLASLAGTFRFERNATFPGRAPERTSGVSENRWILDSHYLECRSSEGEGASDSVTLYGFDARRRVYFALMIGSRGTNYLNLEGFYDDPARSFVLIGRDPGDGRGPALKLRQVVRVDSPDRYVVEIYTVPPGRLPQKVIEVTYSRQ